MLEKIFRFANPNKKVSTQKANTIHYGFIYDGDEKIDEVLVMLMKAPHTYTAEDTVEIDCHGGPYVMQQILSVTLRSGARMAEPGEFTKLAFLNGKMDLAQAEAVIDIIKAKTDFSLGIAESQVEGRLSDKIREMRETLLDILAEMAVDIDYPEEEVYDSYDDFEDFGESGEDKRSELVSRLRWVHSDITDLLDTVSIGRIARDGVRAVIVGKPNAGKSSLMNAILGEGRVIVTDVPGTTRDTVEETAQVSGVPIILIDTAGLRETEDKVEKIGIERTAQAVAGADIVILVLDGSQAFGEEDDKVLQFIEKMNTDNLIVVINKEDLGVNISEDEVLSKMPGATVITTSLLGTAAGDAARKISETIGDLLDLGSINVRETSIITNERHIQMLRNADMNLDEAISLLQNGEPIEVAELSAHYAYDSLGKILGEEVGEEVLNRVFSKFCLGK